jgi:high-affinity iron transporter
MDWSAALPAFLVTLREGVEAALVVGIVLAYLTQAGQQRLKHWVYLGIAAGLLGSGLVGGLFSWAVYAIEQANPDYTPLLEPLLEGSFGLLAIALLSWMLVWMTQQARRLKGEIEGAIATTLRQGVAAGWGIFGLVAIAVLREGFETVLFLLAQFSLGGVTLLGALGGSIGAVAIGLLLFQWGVKIDLRQFFRTMGILLLAIVAGLVISVLGHFDTAARTFAQLQGNNFCLAAPTCFLGPQVWDLSAILPQRQFPGIVLRMLFGYTEKLYCLQAVAYALFICTVGGAYFNSLTGGKSGGAAGVSSPAEPLASRE